MQWLNLISEKISTILFGLAVAAFVFNALTGIVEARQTREYPPGIRVLWGTDWMEVRDGEWTWSFLTLYRITAGLFWGGVGGVLVLTIANTTWGLLVFALPILAFLLHFLTEMISVRHVHIDGQHREIAVRWGPFFPFATRKLALADFTIVRIHEQRGVIAGSHYQIRLEGARKPFDVSPGGRYDSQQAHRLAKHVGYITGLPAL